MAINTWTVIDEVGPAPRVPVGGSPALPPVPVAFKDRQKRKKWPPEVKEEPDWSERVYMRTPDLSRFSNLLGQAPVLRMGGLMQYVSSNQQETPTQPLTFDMLQAMVARMATEPLRPPEPPVYSPLMYQYMRDAYRDSLLYGYDSVSGRTLESERVLADQHGDFARAAGIAQRIQEEAVAARRSYTPWINPDYIYFTQPAEPWPWQDDVPPVYRAEMAFRNASPPERTGTVYGVSPVEAAPRFFTGQAVTREQQRVERARRQLPAPSPVPHQSSTRFQRPTEPRPEYLLSLSQRQERDVQRSNQQMWEEEDRRLREGPRDAH